MIKKIYFSLFLILISCTQGSAKEVSGQLEAGEGSSFIPLQGSAFSITRDVTSGIYKGNYDVMIKNNRKIFYQERNQEDDLYLVFNEPVESGDLIKIEVNKGVFKFKMSHMETLPDVVVDAIKAQVPEQYAQMKSLHKERSHKQVTTPSVKPVKAISTSTISKKSEEILGQRVIPQEVITPKAQVVEEQSGFFENFSEKLGKIFSPAKKDIKEQPVEQAVETLNRPKVKEASAPSVAPTGLDNNLATQKHTNPTFSQKKIDSVSTSIESRYTQKAEVPHMDIAKDLPTSQIDDVARKSQVEVPTMTRSSLDQLPVAQTFKSVVDSNKLPIGASESLDQAQETFVKRKLPSDFTAQAPSSFESKINSQAVTQPAFEQSRGELEIEELKVQGEIPQFQSTQVAAPQFSEFQQPAAVQAPQLKELPRVVEKPKPVRQIEESGKDKIVITKTIAPKESSRVIRRHVEPEAYKSSTSKVPERMSDRVMGGGYADNAKGTLSVKAYSNKRAVSAWVEVFKAGTKQRVKTFYTGKGRTLKDIKLPAGVYVVKATYRTSSMKRQKSLGKVTLSEGGAINKQISFDDGSILVRVKKFDAPLYAKVEIYKRGSKRRIAYDFTSRSTGIAKFDIATGRYDVVVKDHNNIRQFENIRVRSSKTRTLNADF
ncbi:MAG: hypothetical protein K0U47_05805 [Epsilonproteobacteria bacterium]|nr:hypothetical protein [Campylobacterota bacterium]